MSFSVSSVFDPFATPVAAQTHQSAKERERERAQDGAKHRHHRHPDANTPPSATPANPPPDSNSPLPMGTLIDVRA